MAHFQNDTNYYLNVAPPGRFELDVGDLNVEGEVPHQLKGSFYRIHPDPLFPRMTDTDADDVVQAVKAVIATHRR